MFEVRCFSHGAASPDAGIAGGRLLFPEEGSFHSSCRFPAECSARKIRSVPG